MLYRLARRQILFKDVGNQGGHNGVPSSGSFNIPLSSLVGGVATNSSASIAHSSYGSSGSSYAVVPVSSSSYQLTSYAPASLSSYNLSSYQPGSYQGGSYGFSSYQGSSQVRLLHLYPTRSPSCARAMLKQQRGNTMH